MIMIIYILCYHIYILVPCQWLLHCVTGKTILMREGQALLGISVTVITVDQISICFAFQKICLCEGETYAQPQFLDKVLHFGSIAVVNIIS